MIDFLNLPGSIDSDASGYESLLTRHCLATLRQCARSPDGVEDGHIVCKGQRKRLLANGLVERRALGNGDVRTFATELGLVTMRANASCRDGSERLPVPYRRRLA
jgi:hypothetical protein